MGLCHDGPNVRLAPNGRFINEVDMQKFELITEEIKAFIAC
jgi:(2Fe-2S) ferredoxin